MHADEQTATAVANDARARGARTHIVDGAAARDGDSTIDAIAGAMSFPGAVPRTMDELYDRLTDLSWLPAGEHVLIWVGSDALKRADPKAYLSIRGVLSDSQRALAAGGDTRDGHVLTVALTDRH